MPRGDNHPISMKEDIRAFLAATKHLHDGKDFTDLEDLVYSPLGLTVTQIGRQFGYKTWTTSKKLVDHYYLQGYGPKAWRSKYIVNPKNDNY